MKKMLLIIGAVVLAVALAAGSFVGGMAYQRNQTDQVRANFLRARGLGAGGSVPNAAGNNATGQQRRGFFGGGVTGQVKSVDGNSLTVSTAQNVTTVNLSSTTQIEKAGLGALSDLQPGEQVLVTGQRDANGNIAATQVLILGTQPPATPGAP